MLIESFSSKDYGEELERLPSFEVIGAGEANDLLAVSDLDVLPLTAVSEAG